MEFHELANIFPLIEGEELEKFVADVKEHGVLVPVVKLQGKILDGRNRYNASKIAGVKCPSVELSPVPDDLVGCVMSLNEKRRHLTQSQLAMVGARGKEWYDRQAKERQLATLKQGAEKPDGAKLPPREEQGKSRDKAGKAVGVAGRYIDHASKVLAKGEPELIKAVDEGRLTVTTASLAADKPKAEQIEIANNAKRRYDKDAVGHRTKPNGQKQKLNISLETRKKLHAKVEDLWKMLDKPSLQVSIRDVKNKIGELREMVSRFI